MALTPEDVVNKRFNPTKFREGYDQDEVDDFLDEVVVELRRLNQDNEELRQRLVASEARISELQRGGASAAAVPSFVPEPVSAQPLAPVDAEPPTEAPVAVEPPEPVAAPVVEPEPIVEAIPAVAAVAAVDAIEPHVSDTSSTNNLLQLARRLHEEHVREGIERRDALIAEGHATAARVVAEAEAAQKSQLGALEAQKAELEGEIEELRVFEKEYRGRLKDYISGQLAELEASHAIAEEPEPEAAAADAAPTSGPVTIEPQSGPISAFSNTGDFAAATAPSAPGESASAADRSGLAGND